MVEVSADQETNSYIVESNRYMGQRSLFYLFYSTLKDYIKCGGGFPPSLSLYAKIGGKLLSKPFAEKNG